MRVTKASVAPARLGFCIADFFIHFRAKENAARRPPSDWRTRGERDQ
jgi:hypothetical protein